MARLRNRRLVKLVALGGLFLGLYLALIAALLLWDHPEAQASLPLNKGDNGLWLAHRWCGENDKPAPKMDEVEQLARRCQTLGITSLYFHVGPVDSRGQLPANLTTPGGLARWERLRQILRREIPRARLLAWIGAPNAAYEGKAEDTFDLADAKARQVLVSQVSALLERQMDGVHYDFEPLADGDPNFLRLLEETRQAGPLYLSVACPKLPLPAMGPLMPYRSWFWGLDYFSEVESRCDEIALMGYDTMQPTQELYSRCLAYHVRNLRAGLRREPVIGLPSYDDNFPYHTKAETLGAGLEGARRGGAHRIGLYADWTTDANEWHLLEKTWGPDASATPFSK